MCFSDTECAEIILEALQLMEVRAQAGEAAVMSHR